MGNAINHYFVVALTACLSFPAIAAERCPLQISGKSARSIEFSRATKTAEAWIASYSGNHGYRDEVILKSATFSIESHELQKRPGFALVLSGQKSSARSMSSTVWIPEEALPLRQGGRNRVFTSDGFVEWEVRKGRLVVTHIRAEAVNAKARIHKTVLTVDFDKDIEGVRSIRSMRYTALGYRDGTISGDEKPLDGIFAEF